MLFHSNELLNAPWLYRDVPFDFGIVPIATCEEGAEFVTCASFTYQLYGIPKPVPKLPEPVPKLPEPVPARDCGTGTNQ